MPENKKRLQFTKSAADEEIAKVKIRSGRRDPDASGTQASDLNTMGKSPPTEREYSLTNVQMDSSEEGNRTTSLKEPELKTNPEEIMPGPRKDTYLHRRHHMLSPGDPVHQKQNLHWAEADSQHAEDKERKFRKENRYGSRRYFRRLNRNGQYQGRAEPTDKKTDVVYPEETAAEAEKTNSVKSQRPETRSFSSSEMRLQRTASPTEGLQAWISESSPDTESAASRFSRRSIFSDKQGRDSSHRSTVVFVDEKWDEVSGSLGKEIRQDKIRIRQAQQKKRKLSMRNRITETPDEMLLSTEKEKNRKQAFFPISGFRKWAALFLIIGILLAAVYASVSAVGVVGSGVVGGAVSVLSDSQTSVYTGSAIRQQIVSYAEAFIGRGRYVWGGNDLGTPEKPGSGTDCSGFVQQVFAHFGISLPRTSYADANAGVGIDYSEARPGDIIVYDGHVAIYAGDGQIVQAANERLNMCMGNALYAPIVAVRNVIPAGMDMAYTGDPVKLDDESKHLLATIVYHESGNQSYESKVAVAAEVLNRVKSSYFPNTVYDVLNQKNQYCNTDTEPAFRRMYNSTLPEDCWQAVEDAMNGADPTGGMCFHCTNDYWAAHYAGLGWPNLVIGDQTFHNWGHAAGYFN